MNISIFLRRPVYLLTLSIVVLFHARIQAQTVIPVPVQTERGTGSFTISESTPLLNNGNAATLNIVRYLNDRLKTAASFELSVGQATAGKSIYLNLNKTPNKTLGQEGYSLSVSESGILLEANTNAGLFYGVQTILQLLPPQIEAQTPQTGIAWQIPAVKIVDYPRFAWRGVMLDVSRHFFPKEYVKEYIDQLSRYKFNRLHLHLTDDNGWRLEIKSLPKLTEVGAWRVPRLGNFGNHEPAQPGESATYGGFFTQEDMKEIIQYAKDRFVEILPEIDVPGHSMAALAAYPELSVTKDTVQVNPGTNFSTWHAGGKFTMHIDNTLNPTDEKVYQFMEKVITEVAALFPFEYIHIGGDECYKGYWERDAGVQAFMKKNKLKDANELQSYFMKRVGKMVTAKNKKMIGWDEILEGGLAPGAAVMSWRGTKGGIEASHLKHPVVMSPNPQYYLDMRQGEPSIEPPVYDNARLKDVYHFNLLPEGIDSAYVLGGQGNLWTEQIPTSAQAEYMTYPRAWAMAESLWSPQRNKNWRAFTGHVENHFTRMDHAGVNYSISMYDPIIKISKNSDDLLVIELETEADNLDLFFTLDNTIPNHHNSKYSKPIVVPGSVMSFRVISYRNGKPMGRLITLRRDDLAKRVRK